MASKRGVRERGHCMVLRGGARDCSRLTTAIALPLKFLEAAAQHLPRLVLRGALGQVAALDEQPGRREQPFEHDFQQRVHNRIHRHRREAPAPAHSACAPRHPPHGSRLLLTAAARPQPHHRGSRSTARLYRAGRLPSQRRHLILHVLPSPPPPPHNPRPPPPPPPPPPPAATSHRYHTPLTPTVCLRPPRNTPAPLYRGVG
jgi:hypothetical protein